MEYAYNALKSKLLIMLIGSLFGKYPTHLSNPLFDVI